MTGSIFCGIAPLPRRLPGLLSFLAPLPYRVECQRLLLCDPGARGKAGEERAPKRIITEGFACPNPRCTSYEIADAYIHALVGVGKHGQAERIQTFRCQACHSTFTDRRYTPLYRLKTPSQQFAVVLTALVEGLHASAAERVFGYHQTTVTT